MSSISKDNKAQRDVIVASGPHVCLEKNYQQVSVGMTRALHIILCKLIFETEPIPAVTGRRVTNPSQEKYHNLCSHSHLEPV